eukprot:scaffold11.g3996.t1
MSLQMVPQQQPQQPGGQQQQQQPKRRRRGDRGGRAHKRAKRATGGNSEPVSLGFFGSVPNLQEMQAANRQATKRYFKSQQQQQQNQSHGPRPQQQRRGGGWRRGQGPTPRTVPPAPGHDAARFPFANSDPLLTPAAPGGGAAEPAALDKLAEDGLNVPRLDMYGTNEGMLFQDGPGSPYSSELSEGELASDGEGDEGEAGQGDGDVPRHVRRRLAEQEAIIAELEDENLRLRERVDMMQQEIDELRGRRHEAGDSDGAWGGSEAEEVASVMPHPVGSPAAGS